MRLATRTGTAALTRNGQNDRVHPAPTTRLLVGAIIAPILVTTMLAACTGQTSAPPRPNAVSIDCDELVTLEELYDWNPNVSADPSHLPTDSVRRALDLGGISCGWVNQTSGVRFNLALVILPPDRADAAMSELAATSRVARVAGLEAYFVSNEGVGKVDAFSGSYWLTIESSEFVAPEDAEALLSSVVNSLP